MRQVILPKSVLLLICLVAMGFGGEGMMAGPASLWAQPRAALVAELRDRIAQHGLTPLPPPPPVSDEMFVLGQALAHDKILSGNQDVACLTCHPAATATDDNLALSIGVGGTNGTGTNRQLGAGRRFEPRNAPHLTNLHVLNAMFWDGRVTFHPVTQTFSTPAGRQLTPAMQAVLAQFGAVSAQAMFPVTSRLEMRGEVGENEIADIDDDDFTSIWEALMDRLLAIPTYRQMFQDAYPGTPLPQMTFAHAANAISGFEVAAFHTPNSPWDRFLAGDDNALSDRQLKGGIRFLDPNDGNCVACHNGPNFTDEAFHNTGLAQFGDGKANGPSGRDDFGRETVTGRERDRYRFRTAPLRNLELTGPYGHAGQLGGIENFIAHYKNPAKSLRKYDITKEVADPAHHDTQVDNFDEVVTRLDPILQDVNPGQGEKLRQLAAFIQALTADTTRDLCSMVPTRVPSELPIDHGGCLD